MRFGLNANITKFADNARRYNKLANVEIKMGNIYF